MNKSFQILVQSYRISIGIELIQFIENSLVYERSTDIDDVILNTLGGAIGVISIFCLIIL
ncbi:VanZ family protein [Parageobacillus thermoglucosidasius]|uniref:VanZ family protein n=1 Tax=Parageobacillus thermoglucosidasius TaxID=1426 RepID=A0AB38QVT7_PARTM|nr:VanZ family protein [Parageobacillus thermoglucosidasius]